MVWNSAFTFFWGIVFYCNIVFISFMDMSCNACSHVSLLLFEKNFIVSQYHHRYQIAPKWSNITKAARWSKLLLEFILDFKTTLFVIVGEFLYHAVRIYFVPNTFIVWIIFFLWIFGCVMLLCRHSEF